MFSTIFCPLHQAESSRAHCWVVDSEQNSDRPPETRDTSTIDSMEARAQDGGSPVLGAELQAELASLRLGELKRRARAAGVASSLLEAADDAEDPKEAVIRLLMAQMQWARKLNSVQRGELFQAKLAELEARFAEDMAEYAALEADIAQTAHKMQQRADVLAGVRRHVVTIFPHPQHGIGVTLEDNVAGTACFVVNLVDQPDGSAGAAERAGVKVGSIVLAVCGESVRGSGVATVGALVNRVLSLAGPAEQQPRLELELGDLSVHQRKQEEDSAPSDLEVDCNTQGCAINNVDSAEEDDALLDLDLDTPNSVVID